MGLSEDIVAALRDRYQSGATFAELGKDAGVSQRPPFFCACLLRFGCI